MPHKARHEFDYDDDFVDDAEFYDDYDEATGDAFDTNGKPTNPGIWRCAICTYDNDQSLSSCDICGVIRSSTINFGSDIEKRTAPFKFGAPSPDVVFSGMQSSRTVSKYNALSDASSSVTSKNGVDKIKPTAQKSNKSGKFNGMDGSDTSLANSSKPINHASNTKKFSEDPVSMSKDKDNGMVEIQGSLVHAGRQDNLSSSLSNMSFDVKSENMCQMNLAIVGHVDSGKSTLSGRLLHLLGKISQREMHRYEKEAKLQGKESFSYAFALDESADERERGITMTVAVAHFDSKNYHVVVLDAPGHKDFVPNMISGATQADAAVLVVDASIGSFEVGMDSARGQTREHVQLVRSFGVDQIIVAVNKMDAVAFSKERFDLIKEQLGSFLQSCRFKSGSVSWVPLSAIKNENLVTPASDARLAWYQGLCLLDSIDSLKLPGRDFSKPLIMPICDVVHSHSSGHLYACGKLEAGGLQIGLKVLVMPSGDAGTVHSLERNSKPCSAARAGDNVDVMLHGINGSELKPGFVLCLPDYPVATAHHLELKLFTLEGATPILIGSQVEFHLHHVKEVARVVKLVSLVDSKTGKVKKTSPRCVMAKQSAVIEVVLDDSICVDMYSNCRALGRVSLRATGRTIAVGIVLRLVR